MKEALELVRRQLGRSYPLIIGGEQIETRGRVELRNPANRDEVLGSVASGEPAHAEQAIAAAQKAFSSWSQVPAEVRARYLVKVAALLRRRIYEFSAWMVVEASKTWLEAYADAAEAVDFLEFYAREAVKFGAPHPTTPYPGEENEVRYLPLGVGAIISPWNFPLAIMAGMTVAAVVTGNTVVVKPAEQTPIIAAKFFELLEEASLPPGVANLIFGDGETLCRPVHLVYGQPGCGAAYLSQSGADPARSKMAKKVVLEMGGKDAILVDAGVDPDVAAEGIVAAAFGFQGQKCSACSRLIVHQDNYDAVLEKVVSRASQLTLGDPADNANALGAVIDADAYRKIHSYIEIGRGEGRVVLGGEQRPENSPNGYFIRPVVVADVESKARIAQEEIFGPVLAMIKARDFDHALAIANDTDYALTGSCYSNNRAHLERARHEFHVGNLYLNRKCTGALVDVQPFGGFNLSGTDSKAGGRDYLLHFLQAKSITERW
ncbi:uncharacterized protein KY384_000089 [Bacidia gigantensis]|uniref:uncharacterized protein n=1 Tax=Bacidia gigantensis TaxID=2732470 RepID=UPI001D05420F|nr:uncharacterized protein KY384_000089 [Bacidia gigantensis]KAG8526096.1 hypothetical protein KY384_000089 [Bacidia gigantensis]